MSKTAWPTTTEVGNRIVALGLASVAPDDLQTLIDAAVAKWEAVTGFRPFLEIASASYRYDPPELGDFELPLGCGFSAISAVATGLAYGDSTGTVLTEELQYDLLPIGAPDRNQPYTSIRFRSGLSRSPNSIKVTGTKGYSDIIPDDVWNAVMGAVVNLWLDQVSDQGGDLSKIKQGPVELEYASGKDGAKSPYGLREAAFDTAARRYVRI